MLRAVLFDWGDTLMEFHFDPELVEAGHRAGLEALGRDGVPDTDGITAYFREHYLPLFWVPGTLEEIEYPGLVRELLGHIGVDVTDEELGRFLEAEHAAWEPSRNLGATTHALLEALRSRGLKLGLVSNAFDPGWLLHRDLERMGIAEPRPSSASASRTRRSSSGRWRRSESRRGRRCSSAIASTRTCWGRTRPG